MKNSNVIEDKNIISFEQKSKQKEITINTSDRSNAKFWKDMKKIKPSNERMKLYGQKVRNELFHKSENIYSNENKNESEQETSSKEIIYPNKKFNLNNPQKTKIPIKIKITIGIFILIFVALKIYIIISFLGEGPTFESEKFVTKLNYKENQIMRFQNLKTTKIFFDFGNMNVTNTNKTLKEYFDFVIGINKHDIVIENKTKKDIFQGYIFLENYMLDNESSKMLLQNSSIFDKIWAEKKNLRFLQENGKKKYFNFSLNEIESYGNIDNGTLPIMKFIFYRNGKIKEIFKPKNLTTLFYNSMNEVLEKVIPKITEDYFNKSYNNISEALEKEYEKINNNSLIIEEEESNEEEEEEIINDEYSDYEGEEDFDIEEEERRIRILNEKNGRYLQMNNYSSEEREEFIDAEYDEENDFSIYLFNNELNEEKSANNTNLNYYSHSIIKNDYAQFKGSQQNTSINSVIDENNSALKEVHYSNKGIFVNDSNFSEELDEEKQQSCSNDNFIDCDYIINDKDENIINTHINALEYEVIEDVLSLENFIDNKKQAINKLEQIFNVYENNTEIIQINEKMNSGQRLLRHLTDYVYANKFDYSDVEIHIEDTNKKRRMGEYNEYTEYTDYYGMKNIEYAKNLFNLNLLGIQAKLQIINTLYIKEGISVVKLNFQLGFIKVSITLKKVKTNLHFAIRNYNEMGFTELYLINESNIKLENRNEKYSNLIINLEKDFNNLITNRYDFSNIFKESFNEMYEKIKTFTSEIFNELIAFIRKAYDNYTEILNDVNNNRHQVFIQIRNITKNEYINFVEKMLLLVEDFNNKTIIFLIEVEEEVSKIENFQLDILYDLKDIIYETKKIFKDFNKNLFMAIEKGIQIFRYDFDDFVHEIIGSLLYLVDFLSINLNKNEILMNAIDIETREEVTFKLKNIRNIINIIKEKLLSGIDNDYKEEMNETNLNSIKLYIL